MSCSPSVRSAGHSLDDPSPSPPPPPPTAEPSRAAADAAARAPSTTGPPPEAHPEQVTPLVPSTHSLSEGLSVPGQFRLEAWSRSQHWLAYCSLEGPTQASPPLYFVRTHRVEQSLALEVPVVSEPIDALLAFSPEGRLFVALQGTTPWLIDGATGARLDLSPFQPDLSWDASPDHRSFAFSPNGEELALLTSDSKEVRLIDLRAPLNESRDVPKSRAVSLDLPAWRVHYEGASLVVRLAPTGARSWPIPPSTTPRHRCLSEGAPFDAYANLSEPHAASKQQVRLIAPGATRAEEAPGFLFAVAQGWVRREADGKLLLVKRKVQKQIASARCGGRILHADPKRELFLVSCEQYRPTPAPSPPPTTKKNKRPPQLRFPLYLLAPGYVRDLEIELMRTGVDLPADFSSPRFIPLRAGSETGLIDLDQRRWISLGADAAVLSTQGEEALLRRNSQITHFTAVREKPLDLTWTRYAPTWTTGAFFLQGRNWGGWSGPRCSLDVDHAPLALSPSGALLSSVRTATHTRVFLHAPCGSGVERPSPSAH